jgi:hypothetical protein
MRGVVCPKFRNAPDEHIGAKVPVVTTSILSAALAAPCSPTTSTISSAVTTTTSPFLIFSFISS